MALCSVMQVYYHSGQTVSIIMMSLTLSESKCKRQQGLSPGQELRKVLPCDDRFERLIHSLRGCAGHWSRVGM